MTDEDLSRLADLARIKIPADQRGALKGDITKILDYVAQHKGAPVPPGGGSPDLGLTYNVWREDEEVIATQDGGEYLKVKKIL